MLAAARRWPRRRREPLLQPNGARCETLPSLKFRTSAAWRVATARCNMGAPKNLAPKERREKRDLNGAFYNVDCPWSEAAARGLASCRWRVLSVQPFVRKLLSHNPGCWSIPATTRLMARATYTTTSPPALMPSGKWAQRAALPWMIPMIPQSSPTRIYVGMQPLSFPIAITKLFRATPSVRPFSITLRQAADL